MRRENIKAAVLEATKFIDKATEVLKALDAEIAAGYLYPKCPKESGAARRASMELTRALAEMRRP